MRWYHAQRSWFCYLYSSCEIKDLSSLEVLASAWHHTYVFVKYDDKREEGWMAAQKVHREMETKFISWQTEIHLFILSRSKRYGEWKKICFCWKREIQIMVFGHNTKPEADLNTLRKQNSGLSLKGKNKQFTFHSVSVQTKLRNAFLWQGQSWWTKQSKTTTLGLWVVLHRAWDWPDFCKGRAPGSLVNVDAQPTLARSAQMNLLKYKKTAKGNENKTREISQLCVFYSFRMSTSTGIFSP